MSSFKVAHIGSLQSAKFSAPCRSLPIPRDAPRAAHLAPYAYAPFVLVPGTAPARVTITVCPAP